MFKIDPKVSNILKEINSFAKERKASLFLVGGFLRDFVLGREKRCTDFDFAVRRNAIPFGRELANLLKCAFIILDKTHGSCRIVKKVGETAYTFDFTDFRGKTIEEDLQHRDFTINTFALGLESALDKRYIRENIIDIFDAKRDIKRRIIRAVSSNSFTEDPLRVMRAFSFSAILGFSIDKATLKLAKKDSRGLAFVSGERLRDELFKVLATEESHRYLLSLDEIKALDIIFPEIRRMRRIGQGPYHHLDVWQHTLESIKQLEALFSGIRKKDIAIYLDTVISSDRRRKALLKLGALLHDIGKPDTLRHKEGRTTFHGHERVGLKIAERIAKRLKLSNDEVYSLHKMVLWHLRPGYLADSENPTARAKFRYFRDTGREALGILLLSLADQRATKGPLTTLKARKQHERVVSRLIDEYLEKSKQREEKRLLNGHEIMKKFNLKPSSLIGKALKAVEELQGIGRVRTKEQAYKAVARALKIK